MKKITLSIVSGLLLIGLSACNSSDSKSTETNPSPSPSLTPTPTAVNTKTIVLIEECTEPATIEGYTMLQSKDNIIDVSGDAIVSTYHDENNTRSICLNTGEAHIERPLIRP